MHTLFVYFLLCCASAALSCSVLSECNNEQDAILLLNEMVLNKDEVDVNAINLLIMKCIERSWWSLASSIIEECQKRQINVADSFDISVREKTIQMRKLQSFFNAHKQKYSIIAPSYQWAEGLDDLAINIKLAHKWDAPATLGCDDINIEFGESSVVLEAKCPSTSKTFKLNLQLNDRILPEALEFQCTWSRAAVSRLVINIKKDGRGLWTSLLGNGYSIPRNAHKWFSMQEQMEKADKERMEEEHVAQRLEERKREKELRDKEDLLMEQRKHKINEEYRL